MIKQLLKADEEMPPGTEAAVEEVVVNPPEEAETYAPFTIKEIAGDFEAQRVLEIPEDVKVFPEPPEAIDETARVSEILELNPELIAEPLSYQTAELRPPETAPADSSYIPPFDNENTDDSSPTLFKSSYTPESPADTVRQSGLAYSAAIILFGSVVFMLILGWFADLVLGSSPWGVVGGIVLGAIIGFVQFFRITSQIFRK